jgi:hypothetical protein
MSARGSGPLFAAADRFQFSLVRVARFPSALLLVPDPPDPFVALTEVVWSSWPRFPPYRGAYDEIVPHLTALSEATDSSRWNGL